MRLTRVTIALMILTIANRMARVSERLIQTSIIRRAAIKTRHRPTGPLIRAYEALI